MKRLLCIISSMNAGGAETFLMKLYRELDRTKYQMDFCVVAKENVYEKEIRELGGCIHHIPLKSKHPVKAFLAIKNVVKNNGYDCVLRVNEHSLSVIDLLAARAGGAKHLAMRSSNASSGGSFKNLLHKLFFFLPRFVPNVKLAPSEKAARYTFGKNCIEKGNVYLLRNGLDIDLFRFNEERRAALRQELGLENHFVVGHVGRFNTQKNHAFLVDVFYEIQKKEPKALLVLVGIGDLQEEIRSRVQALHIQDKVRFLGLRSDVNELVSAMDVFLFPSFYEGMPNTVIEAQTSGLPCVISDSITAEAAVTPLVEMISLEKDTTYWAERTIAVGTRERGGRETVAKEMRKQGYDIKDCVKHFSEIIFETL